MKKFIVNIGEESTTVVEYSLLVEAESKKEAFDKINKGIQEDSGIINKYNFAENEIVETGGGDILRFFLEDSSVPKQLEKDVMESSITQVNNNGEWVFNDIDSLKAILRMGIVLCSNDDEETKIFYSKTHINPYRVGECAIDDASKYCDGKTVWKEVA